MRNRIIIGMFAAISLAAVLIIGLSASSSDRGQAILDNYGTRPVNKQDAARFHLAMKLLTGHYTDAQKTVALKYINHATKDLEPEIWANFDRDTAVDLFYRIGTVDISDLRTIYATPFDKGTLFNAHSADEKTRIAQQNFALGFIRYDLSPDQQMALIAYAEQLPRIFAEDAETARRDVRALDDQMAQKFPRQIGRALFATIGKDSCGPSGLVASVKEYFSPTCVCNYNTYNWSCNDSCLAVSCNTNPGNCGPLYMWDCIAMCNTGDMEIQ